MPDESGFDGVGKTKSLVRVDLRKSERRLADSEYRQFFKEVCSKINVAAAS